MAVFCYALVMNEYLAEIKSGNYQGYKMLGVGLGLIYCLYYIISRTEWHFIDFVNLIIHEAGHVVFMFFGQTLAIAGGSIFQIMVPVIFAIYFFSRQSFYSAAVMAYWVGLNFINVSVYAADAKRMQLPLLTGDTDSHDWNQLLFQFNQLRNTEVIANIILSMGIVAIILGFLSAFYVWYKNYNNIT
jgi:hypothetical protein